MRTVRGIAALGCGLALLAAVGCRPGAKDLQLQQLQEENNKLQQEKANLLAQLRQCMSERDQLRSQLADLQGGKGPVARRGEWVEGKNIAWATVAEDILFASGKADLKSSARAKLDQLVADIRERYPHREIFVVGHTDTDPIKYSKWKDNLELSVQRGAAVFREFQRLGLEPVHMIAAGQGEWNPIAPNDTAADKQKNRRVVGPAAVGRRPSRHAHGKE